MKKIIGYILCLAILAGVLALTASAAGFRLNYYYEEIYAGGIMDLYVFPDGGKEPYTYQWQVDYGIGDGNWGDLEDNNNYSGTKTDHLKLRTNANHDYSGFEAIPFQCKVTDADGKVRYTPNIYMHIYKTESMINNLKNWDYGLYEPSISNVAGLYSSDDVNYTASAFAGSKINVFCGGNVADSKEILRHSEVKLTRDIHITENGHTTKSGDNTTYIPYTVGKDAVTIEIRMNMTIGDTDLGVFDKKIIKLNVVKPTTAATASVKSNCSLLRYTYNESQKLASIPKGTKVDILSKDGSYYQVFYNNMVGYVGTSLLDVQLPSYDPVIKNVDVTIPAPMAGWSPSYDCQILTDSCRLYSIDPVNWLDVSSGEFMTPNEKFREGQTYTLTVWIEAKSGYKFQVDASYNPKLTGSINVEGMPFIYKAYEQDPEQVIEFSYTFIAKKNTVLRGDLNGDGVVDNQDVEYLLWHTLFPDDNPLNQDGNFDGLSGVDNRDVEYLLWHTLFPVDYPL